MTRSKWQMLAELDEILNKAARLTDKSYSIESVKVSFKENDGDIKL